jgi:histidyl-tRNA synthetase
MQTPKGTRDFVGEDAELYFYLIDLIRRIYEKYGFVPLDTPAFESLELLTKKSGQEIEKEIYSFKDKSGRELGLRFDLTVPMARVVSSGQFKKPFKRYQIGKAWRYDQPQAGRFREFTQADIDTIGTDSVIADLECLQVVIEIFNQLGLKATIRVNNRKILQSLVESFGVKKFAVAFRIIDKQDKIGWKGVERELKKLMKNSEKLLKILKESNLKKIESFMDDNGNQGLEELDNLFSLAKKIGIEKYLKPDLSLVRGLDYYTGNVFEISSGLNVSVGGGGRYDDLTKVLGGKKEPAVGISIGVDRLMEVLKKKGFKIPKNKLIYIATVNKEMQNKALKILDNLRKNNIRSEMNLAERSLSNQLKFASSKGAEKVVIIGPKDLKKNQVTIRDMNTGKEKKVKLKNLTKEFKSMAAVV